MLRGHGLDFQSQEENSRKSNSVVHYQEKRLWPLQLFPLVAPWFPNSRLTVSWMLFWHSCHQLKHGAQAMERETPGQATESFSGPDMFESAKVTFTIIKEVPVYTLNWSLYGGVPMRILKSQLQTISCFMSMGFLWTSSAVVFMCIIWPPAI